MTQDTEEPKTDDPIKFIEEVCELRSNARWLATLVAIFILLVPAVCMFFAVRACDLGWISIIVSVTPLFILSAIILSQVIRKINRLSDKALAAAERYDREWILRRMKELG